jgi:dienelactone hydrolase
MKLVASVAILAGLAPAALHSRANVGQGTGTSRVLAEPITMRSGVYNPWTDRCSDPAAPVRRKMYVRQPAAPGGYPVFLFLIGTLRAHDNAAAREIVDRAAKRGYVAAAVDYDTIAFDFHPEGPCDSITAKAACSFAVESASAPESALHLICGNVRIDGRRAGLQADCDRGIVVAGFSQGGSLAMLARDHDERVRAAWVLGFHDQALPDKDPLLCLHGSDGRPPGPRRLPSERLRVVVGENDRMLRRPLQPHLEAVTGRRCEAGAAEPCFAEDGSGWAVVPNEQCARRCSHEYLDDDRFRESARWWGADRSLDWLTGFASP